MLVFKPIAAIAITIKNLLNSLIGEVTTAGRLNTVVITEASTKNKIKNGKIFLKSTLVPEELFSFFVRTNANTRVIGMIAKVRVNFTMVAASNVLLPCIPSQAAAAAVTEEVSLIAVPANKPNPSLLNPCLLYTSRCV